MSGPKTKHDELVEEFASLLDESLIIAITTDHDLDDPAQYEAARDILKTLASDVVLEEATGFNASGVANAFGALDDAHDAHDARDSSAQSHDSASHHRDSDSCTTAITSPALEPRDGPSPRITAFEGQSDDFQIRQLQDMFADLKTHDIQLAFKKSHGDFFTAMDSLLNTQYLESTGERKKGIDGFFQPEGTTSSSKKKRKKKQRKGGSSATGSSTNTEPSSPTEREGDSKYLEDILFIAEKLDLPYDEASHAFRLQGCSRERTIIDYLDSYIQQGVRATSDASRARVTELSNLYHSIPEKYMPPLIGIAGDVDQWVDELAALLNTYFAHLGPQRLAVDYKLTPLVGAEIEIFTPATASKTHKRGASSAMPPPPPPIPQSSQPLTYQDAVHAASAHAAARSHSYTAAAASFKKGGSNPLYRQAAAYYAERGRAQAQTYAQARSVAADMLVTDNSSRKVIDLHGVEVADGVRIARERAWAWWQGLGEYRDLEARDGFTVITGLGRHSAGGVSRMRQSVAAALIEDGWKVSVETGRFRITGRRRAV
ncbi:hypothetical protein D7B24_008983 [Verticillium nonalfalfae]|uniref:Smr domain-containing protein n=1 Tax=Verticillium nonalfalfae TaxID=1051616 RepID=A0A3M9Y5S2_9PEZI|nr:uncharacterized protein D7B24_008983 [Verticillium nonalfalfae]RNJ55116.1 hypothetical protein D7B24_008983 [Verticillium nonalfalfae]